MLLVSCIPFTLQSNSPNQNLNHLREIQIRLSRPGHLISTCLFVQIPRKSPRGVFGCPIGKQLIVLIDLPVFNKVMKDRTLDVGALIELLTPTLPLHKTADKKQ